MDGTIDALDRAQAQGAAPGTEVPVMDVAGTFARIREGRQRAVGRALTGATLLCLAIATWHGGHAAYVHAKAALGQHLLTRAWGEARANGTAVRPWPWADTHPIARLTVPRRSIDLLVLEGANGRTLAWGPAHVEGTAAPGMRGNAIVTGHRDTHFAFLRDLQRGEVLIIERVDGSTRRYIVERTFVADRTALKLPADERAITLALVTCYPFDAGDPGTPLRFAVVARADERWY